MLETFAYFLQTIYEGRVDLKEEGIDTSEVPEQIQDFVCEVYLHRPPLSDCLAPTFTRKPVEGNVALLMEFMEFLDAETPDIHEVADWMEKPKTLRMRVARMMIHRFLDERKDEKS